MLENICNNGMFTTIPQEFDVEIETEIIAPELVAMTDDELAMMEEEIFGGRF